MSNIEEVDMGSDITDEEETYVALTTIKKIRANKYLSLSNLKEQLGKNNWADWTRRLIPVLEVCGVWNYVNGKIPQPDKQIKPMSASNWTHNDNLAKLLILQNISKSQLQHINQRYNSATVWQEITYLHQSTGFRTGLTYMRKLYAMHAAKDKDIPEFMNKMKSIIEEINSMHDTDLEINDKTFSGVLMQSLPEGWDQYVDSLHHANRTGGGPVPALNIVHLMRNLKDEYYRRGGRKPDEEQTNLTVSKRNPLANRISDRTKTDLYCKCCKKRNHSTDDCRHLGKPLCANCGCFGHMTDACYTNGKLKRKCGENDKPTKKKYQNPKKRGKYSNAVEEEESAVAIEQAAFIESSPVYEEETYNFLEASDLEDCVSFSDNETLRPLYIECLPDSGTTFHVFNDRTIFTDYRSTDNITVGGVGGTKIRVHGKGTVRLLATHNDRRCAIMLRDVLHIPECKHNLISLGRWEETGRSYHAKNGTLTLYSAKEIPVIEGELAQNNLYWFKLQVIRSPMPSPSHEAFTATRVPWEIWHRRYGHIGYPGLQSLKDNKIVKGFLPDPKSPKTECKACIKSKMAHKPFPHTATWTDSLRTLTHIDLQWVKKLSQCLALLKRLVWRKSNKLHNNLKIIYVILDYLGF